MTDIEKLRDQLDLVAGAQVAQAMVIGLLLQQHRNDPQALPAIKHHADQTRADLLASRASARKIEAFDAIIQNLIASIT